MAESSLQKRLTALEQRQRTEAQYSMSLSDWRLWRSTGERHKITERLSPGALLQIEAAAATMAMFGE